IQCRAPLTGWELALVGIIAHARAIVGVIAPLAGCDALLEFDDLEAAPGLLLLLGGLGDLLRLVVTRFHDGTSFRAVCSAWKASSPGAQTGRRGDAGPGMSLPPGKPSPASCCPHLWEDPHSRGPHGTSTTSPPSRVLSARSSRGAILSLTKRTEPS